MVQNGAPKHPLDIYITYIVLYIIFNMIICFPLHPGSKPLNSLFNNNYLARTVDTDGLVL